MEFLNSEYLYLLIVLLPFFLYLRAKNGKLEQIFDAQVLEKLHIKSSVISPRVRNLLLICSMFLLIIAFARPVEPEGEVQVEKSAIDVVVGFDISKSMFADDVYPNRFELAKKKFYDFLKNFNDANVAVIGFSSQGFLVAPLSRDFYTLQYLVEKLDPANVSLKGTNMLAALESAENLMSVSKKKALLLFTDGGDSDDFKEAIAYAKTRGIKVYVYAIGSEKGGIMKDKSGMLKDSDGNIVITKLNEKVQELALESGGAYLKYSLIDDDTKAIVDDIRAKFTHKKSKEESIKAYKELFYYPLGAAIALFFIALISLPKREVSHA